MGNLWIHAAIDGTDYGAPSGEYVRQIKHDYLRKHYDDPDWNHPDTVADKSVHDHFLPRPGGGYDQVQARDCPSAEECKHPYTNAKISEIAQQNWDIHHQQLLEPEKHQQRVDRQSAEMSGFLSDYALDHPDRVHKWHADGSTSPIDDPRLGG